MKQKTKYQILSTITLFILVFTITSKTTSIELGHTSVTTTDDFDNLTMNVENQPIVDNIVSVRVTYNHTAVVMITDGDTIVGHGVFGMSSMSGHSHSMTLNAMSMIPPEGMSVHVLTKIITDTDLVDQTLTATVYHDYQGDGMVNGSDYVLIDANGDELSKSFVVTGNEPTTIEVQDQEIYLDEPYVVIDRVIVPGPSWQVIHEFDNGALGAMYGIKEQLRHGINLEVMVDLTQEDLSNMGLSEPGDSVKLFAHLHHDNYDRGNFNGTTDPHVFSPAFDDPILGNDTAVPFVITVGESQSDFPIALIGLGLTILSIPILIRTLSKP